jgi:hypothetical protein
LVNGNESLLVYKEKKVNSIANIILPTKPETPKKENIFQFYRAYKKGDQN